MKQLSREQMKNVTADGLYNKESLTRLNKRLSQAVISLKCFNIQYNMTVRGYSVSDNKKEETLNFRQKLRKIIK